MNGVGEVSCFKSYMGTYYMHSQNKTVVIKEGEDPFTIPLAGTCIGLERVAESYLIVTTDKALALISLKEKIALELSNMKHSKDLVYGSMTYYEEGKDLKISASVVNKQGILTHYETVIIYGGARL